MNKSRQQFHPRRPRLLRPIVMLGAGLIAGVAVIAAALPVEAARDSMPTGSLGLGRQVASKSLELVVFEQTECGVCQTFRRRILPLYAETMTATAVPIRFVELDGSDVDRPGLKARLTILPTIVLMKDGAEVERIAGLTAPPVFLELVDAMVAKAQQPE